ncbi:MAG: DNA repair protein RecN [Bacteroidia bacterium]|nr:DNA repair protein RecN [Bacteroidia bacterium]
MLKKLTIQNYALIESLDIEFPNGLIIITGETGAGKSILLGAMSLLLGAKADAAVVKDSSKNCVVEGEFDYNGEEIILRRVVSAGGRSRSFINDEPATMAALAEISSSIIDIHSQHQHLLLANQAYQMSVLDYFAGSVSLLQEYRSAYNNVVELKSSLAALQEEIAASERDRDYKQFQLEQLIDAKLVEGELDELEAKQKQLANAELIKSSVLKAVDLLRPSGGSFVQNLKEASNILKKCSNFVPQLEEIAKRLEGCRIECKDIEQELESTGEDIVASPQMLEQIDERIAQLYSLMRKHSAKSVEELIAIREELDSQLQNVAVSYNRADEIALQIENATKNRNAIAQQLSQKRSGAIKELESVLEGKIRELQMPYAVFRIELSPLADYKPQGKDNIEFLFSANADREPLPLQKVASGGELSRIMLCIKALMGEYTGMPTMIFDEIDTGVSGSIADKMGNLIGAMGQKMQIFAITHLPQIACKGNTHLLVYKEFDSNNAATSKIREITSQERVEEIARMLSGSELTTAAIENARELLKRK